MALFSIQCTTCQARLVVRDLSAIGQILACPKCSSMVQIEAPAGWSQDAAATSVETVPVETMPVETAQPSNIANQAQSVPPPATAAMSPDAMSPAAMPSAAPPSTLPESVWQSPVESQTQRTIAIAFGSLAALIAVVALSMFAWSALTADDPSPATAIAKQPSDEQTGSPATKEPALPTDAAKETTQVTDNKQPTDPVEPLPELPQALPDASLPDASLPDASLPDASLPDASLPDRAKVTAKPPVEQPAKAIAPESALEPTLESSPDQAAALSVEPADEPVAQQDINVAPDAVLLVPQPAARRHEPADEHAANDKGSAQDQIAERLALKIHQMELPGIGLREFVELMIDLTALPIALDLDALSPRQIAEITSLQVNKQDATVAEILSETLTKAGYTYTSGANGLTITSRAAASRKLKKYRYPTADVRGDGPDAPDEFAGLLKRMVAPQSWQPNVGGKIEVVEGELWIEQSGDVHTRLVAFCERLRLARGLPLQSRFSPSQFPLASAPMAAASRLETSLTCTFFEPTPFRDLVAFLQRETGLVFYVDWPSLQAEGFTPRTRVSCSVVEQPLEDALQQILPPLGLGWRMADPRTVEIMGRQRAESELIVAFYELGPLLRGGKSAELLQAKIEEAAAETPGLNGASVWRTTGGNGEIYYDAESRYLVVLQSHAAQAAIARALVDLTSAAH